MKLDSVLACLLYLGVFVIYAGWLGFCAWAIYRVVMWLTA